MSERSSDPAHEAYEQSLFADMAEAIVDARHQASTDELTGLPNRRGLMTGLEELHASTTNMGLIIVDLDRFKAVNDVFGHQAGDVVAKEAADVLSAALRSSDVSGIVGRLGGDEFVIGADLNINKDKNPGLRYQRGIQNLTVDARLVGLTNKVQRVFDDFVDTKPGLKEVKFGLSVGAEIVDPDESIEEALDRADKKMYEAKKKRQLAYGDGVKKDPSSDAE